MMDLDHLTDAQRRSVEYEGGNLFIAAGAGTGKTNTLTNKVVYLMERRNELAFDHIAQLLAITFTERAAGELTGRIRAKLRTESLSEEALLVDGAWISTIHGMCARILRDHAFELGIDPTFTIIDYRRATELMRLAVLSAVQGRGGIRDDERYDVLFDEYPLAGKGQYGKQLDIEDILNSLIEKLAALPHGADDVYIGPAPEDPRVVAERLLPVTRDVLRELERLEDPDDKVAASVENGPSIIAALERAASSTPGRAAADDRMEETATDDRMAALGEALALDRMSCGRAGGDLKELIASYREKTAWAYEEYRQMVAYPLLRLFLDLASEVAGTYADSKREEGVLDENDLLVLLHRAFEMHPELAQAYAGTFRLIMVDEFQDTDAVQLDIICRLAGGGGPADAASPAREDEGADAAGEGDGGRGVSCQLVTVGDEQQSIYGFRGADVSLFQKFWKELPEGSAVERLDTNFRSHPDILAFVNRLFGAREVFGEQYLKLDPRPGRKNPPFPEGVPRVDMILTTSRGNTGNYHKGLNSESLATLEAAAIAQRFRTLADSGMWDPSQMVLLMGRMSLSQTYADALRAEGFEAIITGGSVFWSTSEAVLVGHLARVLANPLDNEALYQVLSSRMLTLSSEELAKLAYDQDGRRRTLYAGLRAATQGDKRSASFPRIGFAAELLERGLCSARTGSLSDAVWSVLEDSGYISRLDSEGATGIAECANLLKAVRYLRELEESGPSGASEVARAYAELAEGAPSDSPGALVAEGQRAIRIMTVHASKGLEFPIVALAEFDNVSTTSVSSFLVKSVEGHIMASLPPKNSVEGFPKDKAEYDGPLPVTPEMLSDPHLTSGEYHRMLAAYVDQEEVAERRRLFYVAATRAREALIVAVHMSHKKDGTFTLNPIQGDIARIFPRDTKGNLSLPLHDTEVDYGGSQPMRLTVLDFEKDDEGNPVCAGHRDFSPAALPPVKPVEDLPALPSRKISYLDSASATRALSGMAGDASREFSYSSIAHRAPTSGRTVNPPGGEKAVPVADEDAALAMARAALKADEDRAAATDLGTAFHRVAEYMAIAGCLHDGVVEMPPLNKVRALVAPYPLDARQRARLLAALERWASSDVAARAASYPHIRAEVPFHLSFEMPGGGTASPLYLEGAIDLLCLDEGGTRAFVVDYKTGGDPRETPEQLQRKHRLQALCYTEALFAVGVKSVELSFTRVEQRDESDQPQVAGYRFSADGEPAIHAEIAAAVLDSGLASSRARS